MNKIYNNLNVENLVKTDWIEQFSVNQQQEILRSLKEEADVSIYAKTEYDCLQMAEIRLGLGSEIDVSIYAKPEIDWFHMREIREKLEKEKYA